MDLDGLVREVTVQAWRSSTYALGRWSEPGVSKPAHSWLLGRLRLKNDESTTTAIRRSNFCVPRPQGCRQGPRRMVDGRRLAGAWRLATLDRSRPRPGSKPGEAPHHRASIKGSPARVAGQQVLINSAKMAILTAPDTQRKKTTGRHRPRVSHPTQPSSCDRSPWCCFVSSPRSRASWEGIHYKRACHRRSW